MQGGGRYAPPPCRCYCLLLKKIKDNPYLKILYLSKLFCVDVPMKKKNPKI